MLEWLKYYFPNVFEDLPALWKATEETIYMLAVSGIISFALGLLFGTILIVTQRGGIHPVPILNQVLDKLLNLGRSIPFIILLFLLLPVSRLIVGTAIGVEGAIVPLVVGTTPFFARQIEAALAGVGRGLIEAAQAIGMGTLEIVVRVYWRESIASLARGTTITLINLISLSAMAGAVGAGGLGNYAYIYGQQRNRMDIIWATVIILVALVTVIQIIGYVIAKRNTK
ncbi:methionine ABC transporter permease [Arcanobacterium ihumii]|uniref:methionine ABC transporter permease n=1 Tax=Arcanobacterium ihumii TaxID=2138162 RepID=UPI000F5360BA|nr:ABC transporter permease subunit [Arcanobacterium ihumii]